jgi:hypothetical protein
LSAPACVFIDLLKKAGTKSVVDCIGTTDDLPREVIVFHGNSDNKKHLDRIYRIYKIICGRIEGQPTTRRGSGRQY